jgi:hypothetical protein
MPSSRTQHLANSNNKVLHPGGKLGNSCLVSSDSPIFTNEVQPYINGQDEAQELTSRAATQIIQPSFEEKMVA